jgi:hypothetical protein
VADKPAIEIEGAADLARRLRRLGDEDLKSELKQAHREGADIVATAVRPLVPVRSGKLLSTLRTTSTMRSGRVVMGRKSTPYAGPIHFGWRRRNIKPNPFMYDALDRRRDEVIDRFKDARNRLVAKIED